MLLFNPRETTFSSKAMWEEGLSQMSGAASSDSERSLIWAQDNGCNDKYNCSNSPEGKKKTTTQKFKKREFAIQGFNLVFIRIWQNKHVRIWASLIRDS